MIAAFRHALGLIVVAGLAILGFAALTGTSQARLEDAMVEADRLNGLEASLMQRRLGLAGGSPQDVNLPQELVWPGAENAALELALQQAVLDAAQGSGMQLTSYGPAAGPETAHHPTIAYELEGIGDHTKFARFLAALERNTPRLAVSFLWLRQVAPMAGQSGAPVSVRMTVWSFREGEAKTP